MRSMTGFGQGQAILGTAKVACELRALNHRFLDVRVRMPEELLEHAFFVEQLARESLGRGRIDIGVRFEGSAAKAKLSLARARSVYENLVELRDALAPGEPVTMATLASLPELLLDKATPGRDAAVGALEAAFREAERALVRMREREGSALARDLSERLERLRSLTARARELCQGSAERHQQRLRDRIARLLDGSLPVDRGRLETELALLADRSDVTEELVRLESHFDQFAALVKEEHEAVGRRLDFLLQEMAREINTLGSKSQDVQLSHLVVEIKSELEKIREQVQNVE